MKTTIPPPTSMQVRSNIMDLPSEHLNLTSTEVPRAINLSSDGESRPIAVMADRHPLSPGAECERPIGSASVNATNSGSHAPPAQNPLQVVPVPDNQSHSVGDGNEPAVDGEAQGGTNNLNAAGVSHQNPNSCGHLQAPL